MAMEPIVNLTVGKIGELLLKEANFLIGVKDQVKSIQRELRMMQGFLIDLEALDDGLGDGGTLTTTTLITAKEIRSIAYEVEDVIDTYILEANPADYKKSSSFKKCLSFCQCLVTTHQVGTEIGDIQTKIAQTMKLLKKYRVDNGLPVGGAWKKVKSWRPAVYAHIKDDHVVGIDEDINKLVSLLTTKENENQIQVLSIAGMGGCGKTTIVRKLYNHESVKQCFKCTAWVTISQQWVSLNGLLDILQKISGETMKLNEAQGSQAVGEKIYEFLKERKYLIVLDDVWKKKDLEEILAALQFEDSGSRVIVTTRSRQIVDAINYKKITHEPRKLTEEESWELIEKIAALSSKNPEFDDFKALGEEMLEKCNGLPLAVVALAGLLAKKKTVEDWGRVKEAVSSRVLEDGEGMQSYGSVRDMLTLSYSDLPRDLKPCFLYLGLFPEDCEIPVGMLIRMWIAEGFISSDNLRKGEKVEDLAREYLDELIGRCVVRVASRNYDDKVKSIEIHDLMREICIKKAKEIDFLETLSDDSSDPDKKATQTRRTVVHSNDNEEFISFSTENRHLRSLFLFATASAGSISKYVHEDRSQLSLQPILKNFKLLRVLNLVCIDTSDGTLPEEIGSLIHLRYFGLRSTSISQLPSSIGNLRNLLTFDYRKVVDHENYGIIPNAFWKIEGIKHIYLPVNRVDTVMTFDNLQHLQTLWIGAGSWMLDQLSSLSKTIQKIHIQGIESKEELEAVFQCPSMTSDCLHNLYLSWCDDVESDSDGDDDGDDDDDGGSGGDGDGDGGSDGDGGGGGDDDGGGDSGGGGDGDGDGDVDGGSGGGGDGDGVEVGESVDGGIVLRDLEFIIKSRYLRKLHLSGRIDHRSACIKFPVGIKKLHLEFTRLEAEATLEALGRLPYLTVLHLRNDSYIGSKWSCYEGTFPQLKELSLRKLPNLEEWTIEMGAMCQLKELSINKCKRLRLPEGLKFMTTLEELDFKGMTEGFHSKIREEDGEDYHIIQHIPIVRRLD